MKANKLKLTVQELDNAFPIELLILLKPEDKMEIGKFKLKAMKEGVTKEEITSILKIMENYEV